jgi:tetratricopeptide (TPR) repeat protein
MDVRPDRQVARAREALDGGDAHAAIHLLQEVVESGQAFADAHHLLGLAYSMVGRREDALASFDRALALNPRYVDALLNRAVTLNELGRADEAADAFAAAQQLGAADHTGFSAPVASRLANMHAELAEAYVEAGGGAEAISQYEAAVALRPEFLDLRYRLARLRIDQGDLVRARLELQAILDTRPAYYDARVALGLTFYLGGDYDSARSVWEECSRERPRDARTSAYLSLLGRLAGSPEGASATG